ncbi:tetratricopeptide repeat protein [Vibrio parahaemolyticus]|uniref:tetratricopeptide repeat protein n=1 Tax=Vibrio parahaemolyticus TaxID=670 RepID=UPI003D81735E
MIKSKILMRSIILIGLGATITGCSEPQPPINEVAHESAIGIQSLTTPLTNTLNDGELHDLAASGQPEAMLELAYRNLNNSRYAQAFLWLQNAVELEYAPALMKLGELYEVGFGTIYDPQMAVMLYREAADLGSVEAMLLLGTMYDTGLHVEQDHKLAVSFYKQAAAKSSKEALRWLIDISDRRLDIGTPFEVYEWKETLASEGEVQAIYETGVALYKGWGTNSDKQAALAYLKNAADHGDKYAHIALTKIFQTDNELESLRKYLEEDVK